jgi:hypothetical protein
MKEIEGGGGRYIISRDGRVFVEMKMRTGTAGYLHINLGLGGRGKKKSVTVHRLVAEAFIENPKGLPCVNHKDGKKRSNHVDNLEWCTYRENTRHAMLMGLRGKSGGKRKLTEDDVREIRSRYRFRGGDNLYTLAEDFGVGVTTVQKILKRKTWTHI